MQLTQIRNLKASIVVQQRKKLVNQELLKELKQKQKEKQLSVTDAESKFQERLNARVKSLKKDNSEESVHLNDQEEMVA